MSVREVYEMTSDLYDINGNQIIEEDPSYDMKSYLHWLGIGKMFLQTNIIDFSIGALVGSGLILVLLIAACIICCLRSKRNS